MTSLSSDETYHADQSRLNELAEWLWSHPYQWREWPNRIDSATHMEQIMHAVNTELVEALRVTGMGSTVTGVKPVGRYQFQSTFKGTRLVLEVKYVPADAMACR